MIKFDGTEDGNPLGYGRIEFAYSLMLRECGIEAAETYLLEERDRAHFMIKRFDRDEDGNKIHMASLAGLIHSNYNEPQTTSYREFLETIHELTSDMSQVKEGFRRMVFNIIARNQDDHVKNFSFLMNKEGEWALSPSYDQTYAMGAGFTVSHQMTLAGKSDNFTRSDILKLAKLFSFEKEGGKIIDKISSVILKWRDFANQAGVSPDHIKKLSHVHRNYLGEKSTDVSRSLVKNATGLIFFKSTAFLILFTI
jgi:serine/threonine-protein kinase HipA